MGLLGPDWDQPLKVREGFRVEVGPGLPRVPELNARVNDRFHDHESRAVEQKTFKQPDLDPVQLVFEFAKTSVLINMQQPKVVA